MENISESSIKHDEIKMIKFLGRGSFGTVYLAEWKTRKVAVKQLSEKKYFDIEVAYLKRADHPSIIKHFGTVSEDLSIILEYAEGGSLSDLLYSKEKYNAYDVLNWAQQIAEGLTYLHNMKPQPLMHRDLKPDNILIKKSYHTYKNPIPKLVISDFGTVAETKTNMTNNVGTVLYMAPEVFKGTTYNEKCDVFSLGIVLWEILERRKPYELFKNPYAILYKVGNNDERPRFVQDWVKSIRILIQDCWDPAPNKRPTMKEVIKRIQKIIADEDVIKLIACFRLNIMQSGIEQSSSSFENIDLISSDDIKFGKFLDDGSFSAFYQAEWKNKQVTVCRYDYWPNYSIENEVRQLSRMQHPNIVKLLGVVIDDNPNFMVLDTGGAESLYQFLHGASDSKYTYAVGLSWAQQCAKGLAYMHGIVPKPFIHRNIMTRNILLTSDKQQIKIANFSESVELKRHVSYGKGGMAYLAPEILYRTNYTEKSDVYSWGIVLWEILAREVPFKDIIPMKIIFSVTRGTRLPFSNSWLKSCETVFNLCWDKDPQSRPSMEEIVGIMQFIRKKSENTANSVFI